MNSNDCELVGGSDFIDEPRATPRVSDDDGVGSSVRVVFGATDVENCVDVSVSNETRSSPELESTANAASSSVSVLDGRSDMKPVTVESENRRSEGVGVCEESDGSGYDRKMELGITEHKVNDVPSSESAYLHGGRVDRMEGKDAENEQMTLKAEVENFFVAGWNDQEQMTPRDESEKSAVSDSETMLSNFDEYVENEKRGVMGTRVSDDVGYGFKVGDMVWGKVKSHPWWPGHIFCEAFASPSVRRTRRERHALVAFFGDSSYGWFDLAELIHFDPHYAEKSRQMTSRNFAKAVEEAVDEVSRRAGLGLACRCRNPYNFRLTKVQGYFAVDVPDYEPSGIYSEIQIGKARDSFQPSATLSFIKQLALAIRSGEQRSIDWIKSRAAVLAYRKAVYEEFDETYAQAFGMQPVRPSQPQGVLDLHLKEPSRAPLSGPLVFAEVLSSGKTSSKPIKVKDHAKKDKYLFKRRDEPSNSKILHVRQGHTSSSSQPVFVERSTLAAGDYVFQKRVPATSMKPQIVAKHEWTGDPSMIGTTISTQDSSVKGGVNLDKRPVMTDSQELKERMGPEMAADSTSRAGSEFSGGQAFPSSLNTSPVVLQQQDDLKKESAQAFKASEGFQQSNLSFPSRVEENYGPSHVEDGPTDALSVPTNGKLPGGGLDSGKSVIKVQKAKLLKRPAGNLDSGKSIIGEKKKKRKKGRNEETGSIHPHKQPAAGKDGAVIGKLSGKSVQTDSNPKECNQVYLQNYGPGGLLSVGMLQPFGAETVELEVPQVLGDLHSLALDPFHGVERKSSAIIRQFILRFRSVVYQKSLISSLPSETESSEVRAFKPPAVIAASGNPPGEKARDMLSPRPPKPPFRSDDPTKAGRKRGPSDRQEEIASKKLKKINNLKSLAAEKANLKAAEAFRGEAKESPALSLAKAAKPKMEPPVKAEDPTMLVMKFPPQTSLPSPMELRARFARFGQLDLSGTRVFWKTQTCRVVFKYKVDAQAAYKYATGNNSLFGNVSVRYHLRDVEVLAPEGRAEDAANDNTLQLRDPAMPSSMALQRPTLQPSVQLKSCLKKSTSEEAGPSAMAGGLRGTPRVKFMLGGEESSGGEQMVGNRNNYNNNNNASFAAGGTSVAMDFNSKNIQKVIPSSSPRSILPFPQLSKPTNNLHHNYNAPPPSVPSIDISPQMLSLLRQCNDVVTNLKGFLGYMPYHTL